MMGVIIIIFYYVLLKLYTRRGKGNKKALFVKKIDKYFLFQKNDGSDICSSGHYSLMKLLSHCFSLFINSTFLNNNNNNTPAS